MEKVLLDLVQDRLRPSYFTFGRIMSVPLFLYLSISVPTVLSEYTQALCQRGETEQAEEWLQRQQSQWALQPNRVQYAMLIHYFAKVRSLLAFLVHVCVWCMSSCQRSGLLR